MTSPGIPIASYARLIGEHAEIAARADRLRAAMPSADPAVMLAALDSLAEALLDHLATEDGDIHPRLMEAHDDATQHAAREAQQRYATLAQDWVALIDEWTESRIAADPATFAQRAAALIDRLHARIREEDSLLYPAALATGRMPLRD